MRLRLSIYIYNAVYVLLPIMLSISVFLLLLAGWKGVRGGLSQLIYHIKYQPSSTFYLPLFPPIHSSLSSLTPLPHPFSSPPTVSIPPSCPLHFFIACLPPPSPRSPSLVPSHFSLWALQRFSEGSHLSFFKQLPYASAPHLLPGP